MTQKIIFSFGYFALKIFFKIYLSLNIKGAKNIPDGRGVIIASNQKSYIDPLLIFISLPLKSALKLYFMIALRHRKKKWLTWLLGDKVIFVKSISGLSDAMKKISDILENKNILLIFPEGDWNPDTKRMVTFQSGVGLIAEISGAPIIPTYIHNSGIALPEGSYFIRKTKVQILFDKQLQIPSGLQKKYNKKSKYYLAISKMVKRKILNLKQVLLKNTSKIKI
ncbi:MAG: 1-acyl-sn-glycerol-3-phosphate acyltransferase [Spirochaetia bacterium]|nr:1-acyl-sn-glycerol-3-phosphate acyltransferase [Spirochaetia bacterium]